MNPEVSIVIPCYNEGPNLPGLVGRCRSVFENTPVEIIFVDNGSKDGSKEILEGLVSGEPWARVVRVPLNQGYGFGILEGLSAARGRILGWTHADMQTDPCDALTAAEMMLKAPPSESPFMVKGRRVGRPILDRLFTSGMSVISSMALKGLYRDVNAQPKLFPRSLLEAFRDPPRDFSLDLYLLWLAGQRGVPVREIPVHFGARRFGEAKGGGSLKGKVKLVRRTWAYIWELNRNLRARGMS